MAKFKPETFNKEALLAYILSSGTSDKREISRHFNLSAVERIDLKRMLRHLEESGELKKERKSFSTPSQLPPVFVGEISHQDDDGELVALSDKGVEILINLPKRAGAGLHIPKIGDQVLIKLEDENPPTGRIIKIIEKAKVGVIGILRKGEHGWRLQSIDKKSSDREYDVVDHKDGEDGELVRVSLSGGRDFAKAKVTERLGSANTEKAISQIALVSHGIPHVFKAATLQEAADVKQATLKGREDWRALPLITIDPFDAKDHDDAVHAEPDLSADNEGGYIVTIAIADVAAYVRPETALDSEAKIRGNSVYFPDRVVPMLPERLSTDLNSLRPFEDKPALACKIVLTQDGRRKSHTFHRVMMKSAAKLSYQEAQAIFDGELASPLKETIIVPLYGAYACLKRSRAMREPLELDLPERKIILNSKGEVEAVHVPPRLDAHKLIEEMMILANVCAAETLEKHKIPCLYRVHDVPSQEKLMHLKEFLSSMDMSLPKAALLRPTHFNRILSRVKGGENEELVNQIILRSQAQAEYTPENIGHFGLNLRRYAHFTSPIRRYADLLVHRGLIKALGLGDDGLTDNEMKHFKAIATEISVAERRAMIAERETNDRLIAGFLADKIGEIFEGRVAGLNKAGLFIKLYETGADGFIPIRMIGDDYFIHDERAQMIIGRKSRVSFAMGDKLSVRLIEAAPVAGALRFELVDGKETLRDQRKKTYSAENSDGFRREKGSKDKRKIYGKRR